MNANPNIEYDAKLIVLGNGGVGKTTLINCYQSGARGPNGPSAQPNMGVEFDQFRHDTDYGVIKVQIWDTVGHERIRSVNSIHYKGALGALLVADLSILPTKKDQSGEHKEYLEEDLNYWMNEFRSKADQDAQLIIVGNKVDKKEEPSTVKILEDFSEKHKLKFFKTSAMMGTNVQEVMNTLVNLVSECYFKDPIKADAYLRRKSEGKKIIVKKKKSPKKCC